MKDAGLKNVNIATNSSPLTENNSRLILEAGLDEIYLTIDSLKKDVYERIRVGLKFEMVYQHIINFIEIRNKLNSRCKIRLQLILQELNQHEGESFVKHWEPLLKSTDQIVITKEHNWASKVNTMEFGDESDANSIPCISLWGTFCIHSDGTVGLCCMDSESEVPLGNVKTQTIQEIWRGEPLRAVREKHLTGRRHEGSICDG